MSSGGVGAGDFSAEVDSRPGRELAASCRGDTGNERLRPRERETNTRRKEQTQVGVEEA